MESEDVRLWKDFLEGRQEALEVLYKKYYNLLYSYGVRLHPDREMVKDWIQDVFLKLCKSDRIGVALSPKVYLLKSLRHVIWDYNAARRDFVPLEEMAFDVPDKDFWAERLFDCTDKDLHRSKRLVSAISQLSRQQQHILYLHYVKNLSHKEIAELLDINVQSSMNAVSRALAKLRSALSGWEFLLFLLFLAKQA